MARYKYCDRSKELVALYDNGSVTHLLPEEVPAGQEIEDAWSASDEELIKEDKAKLKERAWRDYEIKTVIDRLDQIRNDRDFGGSSYQGNATAEQLNEYRIKLCEYPNSPLFPYGERPILEGG